MIELQQEREALAEKAQVYRKKIKERFEKKVKADTFSCGEMVLRWDAMKEYKGNHWKFYHLWLVLLLFQIFWKIIHSYCKLWKVKNCPIQ